MLENVERSLGAICDLGSTHYTTSNIQSFQLLETVIKLKKWGKVYATYSVIPRTKSRKHKIVTRGKPDLGGRTLLKPDISAGFQFDDQPSNRSVS